MLGPWQSFKSENVKSLTAKRITGQAPLDAFKITPTFSPIVEQCVLDLALCQSISMQN